MISLLIFILGQVIAQKSIYIVRHGEAANDALTEIGQRRASCISKIFDGTPFPRPVKIISNRVPRCYQTGQTLATARGLTIHNCDDTTTGTAFNCYKNNLITGTNLVVLRSNQIVPYVALFGSLTFPSNCTATGYHTTVWRITVSATGTTTSFTCPRRMPGGDLLTSHTTCNNFT